MADWRALLLSKMGAPNNNVTSLALYYWAASEGMPAWENNWLATTLSCCGGHSVNSVGVKAYPTVADGVQATWQTLEFGAYSSVVSTFRQGKSLTAIYDAINGSPWCGGCQNGHYPVALYDYLTGRGGGPPPGGGAGGGGTLPLPPPPSSDTADDWSGHVKRSADQFLHIGHALQIYSLAIDRIRY